MVATLKRVGANMCWSPDGAAVYVALGGGQLTRRKRPEFQVERTVALGRRIRDLALCPRGLVVALQDPSELLVLDPVTLERRASIPMVIGGRPLDGYAAVAWVAASPAHPLVYAGNDRSVWTIDPAAGQIVASPDVRGGLTGGRLTLDGSYLFGSVGYDVARLRVEGDGLAFDGYTRHDPNGVMSRLDRVEVSPDGRHVAAPNSGPGYSSDIYDVSDLSQPVTRVTSGAYPEALGFDPRARRIYAQNHEYALLVFGMDGTHQATIIHPALTRRGCTARQLLVAPEGHRVLVLVGDIADGDDTLVWVELP